MSVGIYTYSNYLDQVVDSSRRSNITNVITARNFLNRGARRVIREVDLRSTKRNAALTSRLFNDIYSYASPSDLKEHAIIDISPQVNRRTDFRLELTDEPDFDLKKTVKDNLVALATDELVHRLLFSGNVSDTLLVAATCDSTTADGGTWTAYSDATNLTADTTNFVNGGGALKFDLTGSATTAGIVNSSLTTFDITNYLNTGSVFVWVYINSTTNLTNWILEIGNDTSNYYTQTVTTTNESTSFVSGWNLLRFDFASMTQTGTVTPTTCDHIRFYMTKTAGKNDDGYRVDHFVLHTGEIHNIIYYSRYPWQTNAAAFLENSTADTDLLNAETDEFDGFVYAGKVELYKELRRFDLVKLFEADYQGWKTDYQKRNPSERIHRNRFYYNVNTYRR